MSDPLQYAKFVLKFCFPEREIWEEILIAEKAKVSNTMMCETMEDVATIMALIEMGVSIKEAIDQVEGAIFVEESAVVRITAIGVCTLERHKMLLSRFNFLDNMPPLYGISAVEEIKTKRG